MPFCKRVQEMTRASVTLVGSLAVARRHGVALDMWAHVCTRMCVCVHCRPLSTALAMGQCQMLHQSGPRTASPLMALAPQNYLTGYGKNGPVGQGLSLLDNTGILSNYINMTMSAPAANLSTAG